MAEFEPSEATKAAHIRAASEEFFTDPRSYRSFDLTRDFRQIIACVEPRNEKKEPGKRVKTAVQTAGGGAGEAFDRAISQTAAREELVTVEDGFLQERNRRGETVLGAHHSCKFVDGMLHIEDEIIDPSDFTLDDLERTLQRYGLREDIEPIIHSVQEAAKMQREHTLVHGSSNLQSLIDKSYPRHSNLAHVIGTNLSSIYVTNQHPYIGLDRDRKARLSEGETEGHATPLQGYHESRRAAFLDIFHTYYRLNARERQYRVGAFALRSSASRTVLGRLREGTQFYELKQGPNGIVIAEQDGL